LGDAQVVIEFKSSQEVQSRHLKGLRAFQEEHPGAWLIIVSLDVLPRQSGDIEIMPATYFLQQFWAGKIY